MSETKGLFDDFMLLHIHPTGIDTEHCFSCWAIARIRELEKTTATLREEVAALYKQRRKEHKGTQMGGVIMTQDGHFESE